MSDEDSEIENNSVNNLGENEHADMWRKKMLLFLGYKGPASEHDGVSILEVVHPNWRSDFLSNERSVCIGTLVLVLLQMPLCTRAHSGIERRTSYWGIRSVKWVHHCLLTSLHQVSCKTCRTHLYIELPYVQKERPDALFVF